MTELNELFEQIFHSELKFKARTEKLRRLAQSIEQGQLAVQQTKKEHHTKQAELAVKNNRLADLQVEVKLLTVRRGILQEQKDSLSQTKQQTIQSLVEEQNRFEEEHRSFKKELTEFGCSYDLHGSGYSYRQEETRKKIGLLQDELLLLKTELTEMDVQKEEVQKLEMELSEVEGNLEQERTKSEELEKSILEQEAEIKKLVGDSHAISQKLSKDPDFVRLQRELEACKQCPEEAECKAASRELEELQRKCYHHQMRQQLDRQKNSIQNKFLDSGRRSGHYNPYTCQYVPAPKSSIHSLGEESWSSSVLNSSCSKSSADSQLQSSVYEKEEDFKGSMKLVDDEWLVTGEEEYLEDDEWDMEILESELESPEEDNKSVTTAGSDWNDFDKPNNTDISATTAYRVSKGAMNLVKKSSSSSGVQKAKTQTVVTGASISQQKFPKSRSATNTLAVATGRPLPQSELRPVGGESQPLPRTQSQSTRASTSSTNTPTHQGPALRKRNSNTSCEANKLSATLITDSPEPGRVLRKRSGQSIYKAPGSKPDDSSFPKRAKKVRFHY